MTRLLRSTRLTGAWSVDLQRRLLTLALQWVIRVKADAPGIYIATGTGEVPSNID